jgi:hypothetical protein
MLVMVVERFKPGTTPELYRRFRERGRMAPDDVNYVARLRSVQDFVFSAYSAYSAYSALIVVTVIPA